MCVYTEVFGGRTGHLKTTAQLIPSTLWAQPTQANSRRPLGNARQQRIGARPRPGAQQLDGPTDAAGLRPRARVDPCRSKPFGPRLDDIDWFLAADERGNPSTRNRRSTRRRHFNASPAGLDRRERGPTAHRRRRLLPSTARGVRATRTRRLGLHLRPRRQRRRGARRNGHRAGERVRAPGRERRHGVRAPLALEREFNEVDNLLLTRAVNSAGGHMLLDHRVRRGGSHHQKIVVVRRQDPSEDRAFVGGIDLAHGRRDGPDHHAAIPSVPSSTPRTTDRTRRGTTCTSRSVVPPSMTSRTRFGSAGTILHHWTRGTRSGPSRDAWRVPARGAEEPGTRRHATAVRRSRGAGLADVSRASASLPIRSRR